MDGRGGISIWKVDLGVDLGVDVEVDLEDDLEIGLEGQLGRLAWPRWPDRPTMERKWPGIVFQGCSGWKTETWDRPTGRGHLDRFQETKLS